MSCCTLLDFWFGKNMKHLASFMPVNLLHQINERKMSLAEACEMCEVSSDDELQELLCSALDLTITEDAKLGGQFEWDFKTVKVYVKIILLEAFKTETLESAGTRWLAEFGYACKQMQYFSTVSILLALYDGAYGLKEARARCGGVFDQAGSVENLSKEMVRRLNQLTADAVICDDYKHMTIIRDYVRMFLVVTADAEEGAAKMR